ncbi:hypothetical protein Scep_015941 [Stephania cephalantha]|uniref:Uncharacterized protein n=1 Tax=Stephania cephalantha TaxID=152367 RepID=A0AAP0NSR3_9MAGN
MDAQLNRIDVELQRCSPMLESLEEVKNQIHDFSSEMKTTLKALARRFDELFFLHYGILISINGDPDSVPVPIEGFPTVGVADLVSSKVIQVVVDPDPAEKQSFNFRSEGKSKIQGFGTELNDGFANAVLISLSLEAHFLSKLKWFDHLLPTWLEDHHGTLASSFTLLKSAFLLCSMVKSDFILVCGDTLTFWWLLCNLLVIGVALLLMADVDCVPYKRYYVSNGDSTPRDVMMRFHNVWTSTSAFRWFTFEASLFARVWPLDYPSGSVVATVGMDVTFRFIEMAFVLLDDTLLHNVAGGAIGFVFVDDSSERIVLVADGVDVPIFIFHSTHMINWLAALCGATDAPELVAKISSVIADDSYFTQVVMGFNHSDAKGLQSIL